MRSSQVKKILVFCGSLDGPDPVFAEVAQSLGSLLGQSGYELVYGGGFSGLPRSCDVYKKIAGNVPPPMA